MTAKLRKWKRLSIYIGLLAVASILSFLGQRDRHQSGDQEKYSLVPTVHDAQADVIGNPPVDTESTADGACACAACSGSACCDSDSGCDG